MRQMNVEGGFQGRSNKLVDGCYSFWIGAILEIISAAASEFEISLRNIKYDEIALSEFILNCCQAENGGLRDKPSKFLIMTVGYRTTTTLAMSWQGWPCAYRELKKIY